MMWRWSPTAESEVADIWRYSVRTWDVEQADRYLSQLESAVMRLAEHPQMGRIRPELGNDLRSFVEGQHVLFYRVVADYLEVARVLHRSMDVQSQFGRGAE